jgi:hypothetical protein
MYGYALHHTVPIGFQHEPLSIKYATNPYFIQGMSQGSHIQQPFSSASLFGLGILVRRDVNAQ